MLEEDVQLALVREFSEGRVAGAPSPVERVDTHLSHVFLSGCRAFKLKRAVRLPFVDFSSCQAQREACEAELNINRRMAKALYIDALPVIQDANGFRVGGQGRAIDWIVVMRRFDQADQFDRLAAKGSLTRSMIVEVVEAVARAHALAPASEADTPLTTAASSKVCAEPKRTARAS